jgi:tetratricopeptide (TPR) repeat protein
MRCTCRSVAALFVAALLTFVGPQRLTHAATDPREVKARASFAKGEYEEALDLYAKLYAETLHPTYLRNVGRCYQGLRQPDRAIGAFRDYLRKARNLKPSQRSEVEAFIVEMEALKRSQLAEAAQQKQAADDPAPSHEDVPGPSVELTRTPPDQTRESPLLYATPAPTPAPFYKRGWFWGLIGGAVVGSALIAIPLSRDPGPNRAFCPECAQTFGVSAR